MCGPHWLDDTRLRDVKPATLSSYRAGADAFLRFLDEENLEPGCAEEFDDLLVEWSMARRPRLGTLRSAVAAVEFCYPRFKGQLPWCHQRLDSLQREQPISHATPCGRDLGVLLGAQLASARHARYGLALEVQIALGLRPGELLQLCPEDLQPSLDLSRTWQVVVRLGHAVSTKVRREQFALLDTRVHEKLWHALSLAASLTPPACRLFPFSIASFSHWLKRAQDELSLPLGITPHSGRAGFVSDGVADGRSSNDIRSAGRWASESSFRIYVDVVGSLHVSSASSVAAFAGPIRWIRENRGAYYNAVSLDVYRVGEHGGRDAGEHAGEPEAPPQGAGGAAQRSGGRGRGDYASRGATREGGRGRSAAA